MAVNNYLDNSELAERIFIANGQVFNTSFNHKFGAVPSMSQNTTGTIWDKNDTLYPWSAFDTPGTFTDPGVAQAYMSPYVQMSLEPQIAEARRQAEISRVQQAGRLGKAGAFGGSRQAIMESEGQRNLLRNLADIYGTGMDRAYTAGMGQFNTEEERRQATQDAVNRFGLEALAAQRTAGAEQRAIEGEGIAADYKQFLEERDYPYRQATYMQSLLSGLPLETQSYTIDQPSGLQRLAGAYGDIQSFLEDYGII